MASIVLLLILPVGVSGHPASSGRPAGFSGSVTRSITVGATNCGAEKLASGPQFHLRTGVGGWLAAARSPTCPSMVTGFHDSSALADVALTLSIPVNFPGAGNHTAFVNGSVAWTVSGAEWTNGTCRHPATVRSTYTSHSWFGVYRVTSVGAYGSCQVGSVANLAATFFLEDVNDSNSYMDWPTFDILPLAQNNSSSSTLFDWSWQHWVKISGRGVSHWTGWSHNSTTTTPSSSFFVGSSAGFAYRFTGTVLRHHQYRLIVSVAGEVDVQASGWTNASATALMDLARHGSGFTLSSVQTV
ncbi:MAG: hypothetical protein ACHQ2Y_02220 [Candidatus Lutacidiplasmatales archaeon]